MRINKLAARGLVDSKSLSARRRWSQQRRHDDPSGHRCEVVESLPLFDREVRKRRVVQSHLWSRRRRGNTHLKLRHGKICKVIPDVMRLWRRYLAYTCM